MSRALAADRFNFLASSKLYIHRDESGSSAQSRDVSFAFSLFRCHVWQDRQFVQRHCEARAKEIALAVLGQMSACPLSQIYREIACHRRLRVVSGSCKGVSGH